MTELKNILKNIGLNDKESVIYLSCLELSSATVSQIARKAKINRVTTYDVLEKMLSKGLVSMSNKDGIKYFEAVDPEIMFQDFKNKTQKLQESLPDLKRLKGDSPAPRIRYFEGIEGIKAIYEDTLNSKTEIFNYANSTEIRKYWPKYDEEYVQKRIEKKIYLKGLTPDDEEGLKVAGDNYKCYREIRLINKDKYNFPNEINIYNNKVAIISYNEKTPIGMIIQDESIADTQKAIFKMAWDFAYSS